jgi:hypothetical protein
MKNIRNGQLETLDVKNTITEIKKHLNGPFGMTNRE